MKDKCLRTRIDGESNAHNNIDYYTGHFLKTNIIMCTAIATSNRKKQLHLKKKTKYRPMPIGMKETHIKDKE